MADQVREYQEQLQKAEQDRDVLREKLHKAIRKGQSIDREKKELSKEIDKLRQRVSLLETEAASRAVGTEALPAAQGDELKDALKKLHEQNALIQELQREHSEAVSRQNERQRCVQEKDVALQSLKQMLQEARESGHLESSADEARAKAEVEILRQDVQELEARLAQAHSQQETLMQAESEKDNEIGKLRAQLKQYTEQTSQFESDLSVAIGQKADLEVELEQLKVELKATQSGLDKNSSDQRAEVLSLQHQVKELSVHLSSSETARKAVSEHLETVRAELQVAQQTAAVQKEELNDVKQQLQQLSDNRLTELEAAGQLQEQFQAQLEGLQDECRMEKETAEQLRKKLAQLLEERNQQQDMEQGAVEELRSKLVAAQQAERELQHQVSALRKTAEKASVDKEADKNLKHAQHRADDAEAQVKYLEEEMQYMQEALQQAASRVAVLQEVEKKLETQEDNNAKLSQRVAELEGRLSMTDDLETKLEEARLRLMEFEKDLDEATLKLSNAQAELEAKSSRIKTLEQQLLEALSSAVPVEPTAAGQQEERNAEIDAMKAEAASQLAEANFQREAAEKLLAEAEAAHAEATSTVRDAVNRAEVAEAQVARLREEDMQRKQKFLQLQSSFALREATLAAQVHKSEENIGQIKAELQQQGERAHLAEQALTDLQRQMNSAIESAAAEATHELREQLATAEARYNLAVSEASAANNQLHSMTQELANAESASLAAAAAEALMTQLKAELQDRQERLEETEARLAEADRRYQALEAQQQETASQRKLDAKTNGTASVSIDVEAHWAMDRLREENQELRDKVKGTDKRVAAAVAVQQAKVAALEKSNHELRWQVAMLARNETDSDSSTRSTGGGWQRPLSSWLSPSPAPSDPGKGRMAGVVGFVLRHWKQLLLVYFVLLHLVVYFAIVGRQMGAAGVLDMAVAGRVTDPAAVGVDLVPSTNLLVGGDTGPDTDPEFVNATDPLWGPSFRSIGMNCTDEACTVKRKADGTLML